MTASSIDMNSPCTRVASSSTREPAPTSGVPASNGAPPPRCGSVTFCSAQRRAEARRS
jgi:hypothetical protein